MLQNKPSFSIYNASAGSGKTFTLVKEYLKIILSAPNDDAYRNILAITFTNKAVQEMKSRVVDSLFEFTKDEPSSNAQKMLAKIAEEINTDVHTIQQKSKAIIKNIIHNYAAFDISTIDKFTHKVIRSFALDLDLPINFDVSLDTEIILQEAVDSLIDEAGNDEVLTQFLVDFALQKTDEDQSWDIAREAFNMSKILLKDEYANEIQSLENKNIPEFITLRDNIKNLVQEIEKECIEIATTILDELNAQSIDLKSFSRETFPNHLKNIQTLNGKESNHKFIEVEEVKINKTAADKDSILALLPSVLNELKNVYSKLEKRNLYNAFLSNITPLSLINSIGKRLKTIQDEQNIISISEFNSLINSQLKNQPAPFIYERLGEKYRHFFIDEFQDTSVMQWENLIPLIENAVASEINGEKGTLLIVGDPKQSIYRWRGGKAEQFIELTNKTNPFQIDKNEKQVFNLDTNFRSYEQVINFNNDFFQFLSEKFENEDYIDLYLNKSSQKTNDKKGGYVNISFIPKLDNSAEDEDTTTKDELYLEKIYETIQKLEAEGFKHKEIVILVRNNSKGNLIANYLTEKNIKIISSESLLLNSSSEVQFLLNILRFLNDKNDRESLALALYYLAKNYITSLPVHDFILQGIQFKNLNEIQNWLASFEINIPLVDLKRKSLFEMVATLVKTAIPHQKNSAYVQFFLDAVLERDRKFQVSILDFLDYWEKSGIKLSVPTDENADAIRIMTIHKSKGLEFPVVIFPFAEQSFSQNKGDKIWIEASEEFEMDKILVNKSSKLNDAGQTASETYQEKQQEDLLDNINVLYVALTRAEEQLYVISNYLDKAKTTGNLPNNLASYFIEFAENHVNFDNENKILSLGESHKISKKIVIKEITEKIIPLQNTIQPEAIKIAQREALMWGTTQQEAIEFGNTMHEILSYIKIKQDLETAITKAIENGLITENQKETVVNTIKSIFENNDLTDFFQDDSHVFNERAILSQNSGTLIPDRIEIRNKQAYILDYKTGTHQSKYEKQIENYASVIENMGIEVKKKSLIYIGEKIEIVNL